MDELRSKQGFTLVELVTVIAILSVLAMLVIQNVSFVRDEAEHTVTVTNLQAIRDAFCGSSGSLGYLDDMKYDALYGGTNARVGYLLALPAGARTYDLATRRGWHGPYLNNVRPVDNTNTALRGLFPGPDDRRWATDDTFETRGFHTNDNRFVYGATNDVAMADAWGNPFVLQFPTNDLIDTNRLRFARVVSAGPNGILETPLDRLAGLETNGVVADRGDDLILFLKRPDVYEDEP